MLQVVNCYRDWVKVLDTDDGVVDVVSFLDLKEYVKGGYGYKRL